MFSRRRMLVLTCEIPSGCVEIVQTARNIIDQFNDKTFG